MTEAPDWPTFTSMPGEDVARAVRRLRRGINKPFLLRHNEVLMPVHPDDDPEALVMLARALRDARPPILDPTPEPVVTRYAYGDGAFTATRQTMGHGESESVVWIVLLSGVAADLRKSLFYDHATEIRFWGDEPPHTVLNELVEALHQYDEVVAEAREVLGAALVPVMDVSFESKDEWHERTPGSNPTLHCWCNRQERPHRFQPQYGCTDERVTREEARG